MAGTVKASNIQHDVSGVATTFKDGSGTEIGQLCKSWGNFNGLAGNVATRASFNVSSFTRSAQGNYSVGFTNSMLDANYCVNGAVGTTEASSGARIFELGHTYGTGASQPSFTTSSIRIEINYTNKIGRAHV